MYYVTLFKYFVINFCFYQNSASFCIESRPLSGLALGLFIEEGFCPRLFFLSFSEFGCRIVNVSLGRNKRKDGFVFRHYQMLHYPMLPCSTTLFHSTSLSGKENIYSSFSSQFFSILPP